MATGRSHSPRCSRGSTSRGAHSHGSTPYGGPVSPGIFDGGGKWGGAEAGTVAAALPIKGACTLLAWLRVLSAVRADTGPRARNPWMLTVLAAAAEGDLFGGGGFAFGSFGIGSKRLKDFPWRTIGRERPYHRLCLGCVGHPTKTLPSGGGRCTYDRRSCIRRGARGAAAGSRERAPRAHGPAASSGAHRASDPALDDMSVGSDSSVNKFN